MCGEKSSHTSSHRKAQGSPPHVRGKDPAMKSILPPLRITPRMCGEKSGFELEVKMKLGSPPHVRGKVVQRRTELESDGITPACAGKSPCPTVSSASLQDHPRMCGEKHKPRSLADTNEGSPPHVRGKGHRHAEVAEFAGITPACAGKRKSCAAAKINAWDHPRMCGEKSPPALLLLTVMGSPPHVRGKDRINPA